MTPCIAQRLNGRRAHAVLPGARCPEPALRPRRLDSVPWFGEAARAAGVGVETIRFYERQGLIQQPPKPANGGFRRYPPETVARIRFIRQAQQLGFSLRQAGELLALRAFPDADAASVRRQALARLEDVEQRIEQLGQIREALRALLGACPGTGPLAGCSIMEALERLPMPSRDPGGDDDP